MKNLDSLSCAAHGAQRGNGQISAHLPHPLRLPQLSTHHCCPPLLLSPGIPALPWGMFLSFCAHNKDFWLFPSRGAGFPEAGRGKIPFPGGTQSYGNAAAGRDGADQLPGQALSHVLGLGAAQGHLSSRSPLQHQG